MVKAAAAFQGWQSMGVWGVLLSLVEEARHGRLNALRSGRQKKATADGRGGVRELAGPR